MWLRLTGDMGKELLVNPQQVSAMRPSPHGEGGSVMLCLSGQNVYVRESPERIMRSLSRRPHVGAWLSLTDESGRPVYANAERLRFVRSGPLSVGGSVLVYLPGFQVAIQEAPDEVVEAIRALADQSAKPWRKLTGEAERPVLVNFSRVMSIREGPRAVGSTLLFLGGNTLAVEESLEGLVAVLSARPRPVASQ